MQEKSQQYFEFLHPRPRPLWPILVSAVYVSAVPLDRPLLTNEFLFLNWRQPLTLISIFIIDFFHRIFSVSANLPLPNQSLVYD